VVEPLVKQVVVCNPRHNRIEGSRNDQIDARTLAERLRLNAVKALYNSEAIKQRGRELYHVSKRQSWIEKLPNEGQRTRAELFFRQLDELKMIKRGDGETGGGAEAVGHGASGVEKRKENFDAGRILKRAA
jgi:hypothetical protein